MPVGLQDILISGLFAAAVFGTVRFCYHKPIKVGRGRYTIRDAQDCENLMLALQDTNFDEPSSYDRAFTSWLNRN